MSGVDADARVESDRLVSIGIEELPRRVGNGELKILEADLVEQREIGGEGRYEVVQDGRKVDDLVLVRRVLDPENDARRHRNLDELPVGDSLDGDLVGAFTDFDLTADRSVRVTCFREGCLGSRTRRWSSPWRCRRGCSSRWSAACR